MTPQTYPVDLQGILSSVRARLEQRDFDAAALLLADHTPDLLEQGWGSEVATLLGAFPAELVNENSDLMYISGLLRARTGQLDDALNLLERARHSFLVTQQAPLKAANAGLAIVEIYFRQDNVRTAHHYLRDVIEPSISNGMLDDLRLQGRFYLYLADISPDFGRLAASVDYCRRAYIAYQTIQDIGGQCRALTRMAGLLVHLGDYAEAEAKLVVAKACFRLGDLGAMAWLRILNAELHLHWYRGHLADAMRVALEYLAQAEQVEHTHFRVYALLLVGNLARAKNDFAAAERWYTMARTVVEEVGFQRYAPWLDVQMAWLRILQERLTDARLLLYSALRQADLGEAMSFQMGLAVINLLESQPRVAERLLRDSLGFYVDSGDELSGSAIRLYLTLALTQQERHDEALTMLAEALGWMAQRHIDTFPHWWHPHLVSTVCIQALAADLYTDLVERMFVHHLGDVGVRTLQRHTGHENPLLRAHVGRILHLLTGPNLPELDHLPDSPSKRALATLIQLGKLRRERFAELERELTTAHKWRKPNPTALAVFAFYVNGYTREEIAAQLDCSVANVRNYITLAYHHFGPPSNGPASRAGRRQQLVQLAQARGYI
jgi:tetratricopeptide (TPR) repeat protein